MSIYTPQLIFIVIYCIFVRTEEELVDSGVSIAPPERRWSARVTVPMKIQQEVSRACRGSDISESGDSGSEFEQDEESSSTDEECDMPASADEESKSDEKGKKEETVKEKVCVCVHFAITAFPIYVKGFIPTWWKRTQ